jgi:hypothetical protein
MHGSFSGMVALLVLFTAGSPARADETSKKVLAILKQAEQIELISVDPYLRIDAKQPDSFHGWKLLGQTTIKDAEQRKKLLTAYEEGVTIKVAGVAKCFEPRHGIRVVHDGKTIDLVICFSCIRVLVYSGEEQQGSFQIEESPRAVFDQLLKDAKVRLPPPPGVLEFEEPKP